MSTLDDPTPRTGGHPVPGQPAPAGRGAPVRLGRGGAGVGLDAAP
ncbi:MAG: MinD/ParA family protein, partial [Frankia sp.]|nr:MinD/ParA family protein [Frankia sp.]